MRVHHLNCGTMRPLGTPDGLVCHVLLLETGNGLVLVDSGIGLRDAAQPGPRFGFTRHFVRPVFDQAESAVRAVGALGFDPRDVGPCRAHPLRRRPRRGPRRLPLGQRPPHRREAAALHPKGLIGVQRYRKSQRSPGPRLTTYLPGESDTWRGFPAARELTDIAPGIVLIGPPGHTRGHAAVAVDAGDRWVLHAGDAFYHRAQLDGCGTVPRALTAMERLVAHDWRKVRGNHERLAELWRDPDPDLLLVNAHDPTLLREATEFH